MAGNPSSVCSFVLMQWDWDEDEELSEEEVKTVAGCQLLIKSLYGLLNGSLFLLDLEERQKDMMREIEKRQKVRVLSLSCL